MTCKTITQNILNQSETLCEEIVFYWEINKVEVTKIKDDISLKLCENF